MSIPEVTGYIVGALTSVTVALAIVATLAFAVLVAFLVRQPPQRVSDEAPEPFIRARIELPTAVSGAGSVQGA